MQIFKMQTASLLCLNLHQQTRSSLDLLRSTLGGIVNEQNLTLIEVHVSLPDDEYSIVALLTLSDRGEFSALL